ncbi:hypothetical protein [Pontibacillus salipaludis]|uniref:hypothetical protein n=1 Tax=Pontibacillus salipaludis TaxID=1697394 RepID=UPI0031EAD937
MNKQELQNTIKNHLNKLDQSVYGYTDSYTGGVQKYFKRDADISKELYDDIIDTLQTIEDGEIDSSVKSVITIEQTDKLNDLLANGNRIHQLATFDEQEYVNEMLTSSIDAYDEHLDAVSQEATNEAREELEKLSETAKADIEMLISTLEEMEDNLSK